MTARAICQLRWRVTCRSALCVFVMNRALDRSDSAAVRIFEPAQLLPLIPEPAPHATLPDWVA